MYRSSALLCPPRILTTLHINPTYFCRQSVKSSHGGGGHVRGLLDICMVFRDIFSLNLLFKCGFLKKFEFSKEIPPFLIRSWIYTSISVSNYMYLHLNYSKFIWLTNINILIHYNSAQFDHLLRNFIHQVWKLYLDKIIICSKKNLSEIVNKN